MKDNTIGIYLFLLGSIIFLVDSCFLKPISYYYLIGSVLFILGCLYFIKDDKPIFNSCDKELIDT
jgi:hypothetical protein